MALPWFRFHTDFLENPKVRLLPEHMQLRYVLVLCVRRKVDKITDAAIAWHWRPMTMDEVLATKQVLMDADLIDKTWQPKGWDDRQYVSDDATARTRKYRAKKKSEAKNNTTIPPEQNRTERERAWERDDHEM